MPLCDPSVTYTRAVWPEPSPAVLRLTFIAGISEVSRFSCMKFLGVSGVFDYAGPNRSSRYRACSCCLPRIAKASASGLHLFGVEYPPRLSSVYASLNTSRYPAQDSRPSGSLLLSRKELSSSASCRFIPAHCYRDFSAIESRVLTFQILQTSASWVAWKTSVLATDSGKAAKDESAVFLTGAIWTI